MAGQQKKGENNRRTYKLDRYKQLQYYLDMHTIMTHTHKDSLSQGVIFPAGARVLPAGNIEEFTGNWNKNPRVNGTFALIGGIDKK